MHASKLCLRYGNINTVFESKKKKVIIVKDVSFAGTLTNASFYAPTAFIEDLVGYLDKWEDTKFVCPRGMLSCLSRVHMYCMTQPLPYILPNTAHK